MFEVPDAKRVRRSDLYAREGSDDESDRNEEEDPGLQQQLKERLEKLYGPVPSSAIDIGTTSKARVRSPQPDDADDDAPAEFEFRLFATDNKGCNTALGQKIVLEDQDEEVGEGGLVNPRRDRSYYFSTPASGSRKVAFSHAALTGEDILHLSKSRNYGLEVPWRVRVLKVVGKVKRKRKEGPVGEECVGGDGDGDGEGEGKRKRAGKKRRIFLREREKMRIKVEEEKRREREGKEEKEREKRTRRNREKKVKRREKERAEKASKGAVRVEVSDEIGDEKTGV